MGMEGWREDRGHWRDDGKRCRTKDRMEKRKIKKMTGERQEEDGKTHRPIVPAGRQPKSRPLICRSNIREALGWLVGWLAGGKEVPGVRRTPNQSGVRKRYEKDGLGWNRASGWVDGGRGGK